MIQGSIKKLLKQENLLESEIADVMNTIMNGEATSAQIAGFLTALRIKGETIEEIVGSAKVMRAKAESISPKIDYYIDTCGTGGDGANTFNISTAVAFVAASAGVTVAKHGNRSASSKCGGADVLEALGVNINLSPKEVEKCIEETGFGFMFARNFHKSMKHAAGPRSELGIRTIFNILGPLTNPANAKGQVLGVFDGNLTETIANVLMHLGLERALVVHGLDGLDEITTTANTKVSELKDGKVTTYELNPADYSIQMTKPEDLVGGDSNENAQIIKDIFSGQKGPKRGIVLLNSAAALYVGKRVPNFTEGVALASELIYSGKVMKKLDEVIEFTNR